jgi:nicotinate-nucleotide--dimethylbenzimidazole phosphoribosyltransferase
MRPGAYNCPFFRVVDLTPAMTFSIPPLGNALDEALRSKIDNKTKPLGALGQLEQIALQVGRIQQSLTPQFSQPHVLVIAGDHGAARAGVSAYPPEVTWQMVENFLAGGAAINVFARHNGLALKIVDAGVAHDFGRRDGLIDAKIAAGTRNYIDAAAMSAAQCAAALAAGARIAGALADAGCNVLGFGEMGIGNSAAAALITHALTAAPLAECVGRGTGLDDAGLARKRDLLAQAARRAALAADSDALTVLAEFGGFEIVMLAGAMLGAAERRMTLLIDGFIVTSALLAAARIAPAIGDYCLFCHRSAEPGHVAQLKALNADPLFDLGLRLGEGTGAALAWPLVRAAVAFLNEMASFASAGVSEKD